MSKDLISRDGGAELMSYVENERKRQLQTLRSVENSVTEIEAFATDESGGKFADPQKVRALTQKLQTIVGELKKVQKVAWRHSKRRPTKPRLRDLRAELFDDITIELLGCYLTKRKPSAIEKQLFRGHDGRHVLDPDTHLPITYGDNARRLLKTYRFKVAKSLRAGANKKIYKCVRPYDPRTATTRERVRSCEKVAAGTGEYDQRQRCVNQCIIGTHYPQEEKDEEVQRHSFVLDVFFPGPDGVDIAYRVVPPGDRMRVIREVYGNPAEGGFRSLDSLYRMLTRQYVGIHKKDVRQFLDRRPEKQQLVPKKRGRRVTKTIRPTKPMQHWQMDFIMIRDPKLVRKNNSYEYMCVIVDVFSKYLWVLPLKTREQHLKADDEVADERRKLARLLKGLVQNKVFMDANDAVGREARRWWAWHLRSDPELPRSRADLIKLHKSYCGGDLRRVGQRLDGVAMQSVADHLPGGEPPARLRSRWNRHLLQNCARQKKACNLVSRDLLIQLMLADMDPNDKRAPAKKTWTAKTEPAWATKALEMLVGLGDERERRTVRKYANFLDKLEALFKRVGAPKIIQADNEFRGEAFVKLLHAYGVELRHSMPYQPYVQGAVERVNGTFKLCLRPCMAKAGGLWVADDRGGGCVNACLQSYNSHTHSSTKHAPAELHFPGKVSPVERAIREREGLPVPDAPDATRVLAEGRRSFNKAADRREAQHAQEPLKPGDLVRVFINRLKPLKDQEGRERNLLKQTRAEITGQRPQWSEEVYRVAKVTGSGRYLLEEEPVNLKASWKARQRLLAAGSLVKKALQTLEQTSKQLTLVHTSRRLRDWHGLTDRLAKRVAPALAEAQDNLERQRALENALAMDQVENGHLVTYLRLKNGDDQEASEDVHVRLVEGDEANYGRGWKVVRDKVREHERSACNDDGTIKGRSDQICHGQPNKLLVRTDERKPRLYLRHHLLKVQLPSVRQEGYDDAFEQRVRKVVLPHGVSTNSDLRKIDRLIRRSARGRGVTTRSGRSGRRRLRKDGPATDSRGIDDEKKLTRLVKGASKLDSLNKVFRMRDQEEVLDRLHAELEMLGLPTEGTLKALKHRLALAAPLRALSRAELLKILDGAGEGEPAHVLLRKIVWLKEHEDLRRDDLKKLIKKVPSSSSWTKAKTLRYLLDNLEPIARRDPDTGRYFTRDLLALARMPGFVPLPPHLPFTTQKGKEGYKQFLKDYDLERK